METLETRQLLAGPQLAGVQPNQGELIVDGTVRNTSPRLLTFRFDQGQSIDPSTFDAIEIFRAGEDGRFDPTGRPGSDDIAIEPALVALGDDANNEVVVRFAESLPDDRYQIRINAFDDPSNNIVALRNELGEVFEPRGENARTQVINFDLRLGALVQSVVPQPVIRNADGTLTQNRNEVVVYFNEDPLFVEDEYVAEVPAVTGEAIRIEAAFADGELDDTVVEFARAAAGTPVSAEYIEAEDRLLISSRSDSTIGEIVAAVNGLPRFSASSADDSSTAFNAGTGVVATIRAQASQRSAENPRFYQLLLTRETVRTTDDSLYFPEEVVYDPATFTARLFFAGDINELGPDENGNPGPGPEGGTWRLRIGTAVDDRVDIILPPNRLDVTPVAVTSLGIPDFELRFTGRTIGESIDNPTISFVDSGVGGLSVAVSGNDLVYDFGGSSPRIRDLRIVTLGDAAADDLVDLSWSRNGVGGAGGTLAVPTSVIDRDPIVLSTVGDTFATAQVVGTFGRDALTSLVFTESIDVAPLNLQLPELPGAELADGFTRGFLPDVTAGVPTVRYNFQDIFARQGTTSFLNQINVVQQQRIREVLGLYAEVLGVQFVETVDQGITFALGDVSRLGPSGGILPQAEPRLNASLRIDSDLNDSAVVFSNQFDFETAYGGDFTRKAAASVGLLLGLQETPELPPQTLLALNDNFLNASVDPANETELRNLEPVFPSNFDVLQGQALYRPDSNDVDLYRFVVDLDDVDQVGSFTAETFAERLPDASSLDTTLTLFQEQTATVETSFGLGLPLSVRLTSTFEGKVGNDTEIRIVRSGRNPGDNSVSVTQAIDAQGLPISNAVVVDIPRLGPGVSGATIGDIVNAINDSPISSQLVIAEVLDGNPAQIAGNNIDTNTLELSGGGLVPLVRNDDYFSEDSRITATLGAGTYYVGVAASGNDNYDPTITESGYGGRSEGIYELHLKFEPQVDEVDVLRDLDMAGQRPGIPGTPIDGDGDGVPGGVYNFWFQTRSLNRQLVFTGDSSAIRPGQTITITDVLGEARTYQFVPTGGSVAPGNVRIEYPSGGVSIPASGVARELFNAFTNEQARTTASGRVGLTQNGGALEFVGVRSIELSDNFRGGEVLGRQLFVDKTAGVDADGSLAQPFNNISNPNVPNAFGSAASGDIVRIVGNGGLDGDITTQSDNQSYRIGVANTGGGVLEDGRQMEIPEGVNVMIDSGAIFKLRNARIGVGSSTLTDDRSNGALQVLGTPRSIEFSVAGDPVVTTLLEDNEALAGYREGSVIFTSLNEAAIGTANGAVGGPRPGDWGGLVYRRDVDQLEGRSDLEDEGIFLQSVIHADIRYGGGSNLLIDSIQQLVNPVQIFNLRPTVSQSEIRFSADAAISASPDSFEETSFQAPRFQSAGEFTADYDRVGPSIYDNRIVDNSINGLFIRVETTPGQNPRELTTSGRFDDTDIVHYFAENLVVAGTAGGNIRDEVRPDLVSTAFQAFDGGDLAAGTYNYRLTFVDANGFESLASDPSSDTTVAAGSSIELLNLPNVPPGEDYIGRRLYRLNPTTLGYDFVAQLSATEPRFIDDGTTSDGSLNLSRIGIRGRLDASLVIDPSTVMKFRGSRIELGQGTHLYSEGFGRDRVIFTSFADDRFGAGGTFDTNNDTNNPAGEAVPQRGDWSGIYAGPTAYVSMDHTVVAYAGGISLLQGGVARGFAPLELQQAGGRVTNSRFEFNDDGQDGAGPVGRFGRLGITPSTIFVRGSQPIIVNNRFVDNRGSLIDIDSDSFTSERLVDTGRQTLTVDRFSRLDDNFGPLVRLNRYENVPTSTLTERQLSGMEVRGGILTTETIFDDTDIDHMLFDTLEVGNLNISGGLKLLSRSDQSLVFKLSGSGSPYEENFGTGLTANGVLGDDTDRIGGTVQVVGLPGAPVVLTSLSDDTVGSGLTPDGRQLTDTGGDGFGSRPEPNDWRSILLDRYSNDRNFDYILEETITTEEPPGLNGTTVNAQVLGTLAPNIFAGDEVRRLGFEIEGFLAADNDVDTYSFSGQAGTRVFIDVDATNYNLDTVVELLDQDGNVLARSNDTLDEVAGTALEAVDDLIETTATDLAAGPDVYNAFDANGLYEDTYTLNPRDAGFSVTLPGNPGNAGAYFVRVRSRSINTGDVDGGLTNGGYRLQVRLTESQEIPGSFVRFADIRYANHGIHVVGKPGDSPLLGDAQENEGENIRSLEDFIGQDDLEDNPFIADNPAAPANRFGQNDSIEANPSAPGQRPQYIGNLQETNNLSLTVGGALQNSGDIDFYRIDVLGGDVLEPVVFDIDYADGFSRPNTSMAVFYDADPLDDEDPILVAYSEDSNVFDDVSLDNDNDLINLLTAGSVTTGDAFIGPLTLIQGSYFVAIFGDGQIPEALTDPLTRREPIDSVLRIFDDGLDRVGGTTALPPVNPNFVAVNDPQDPDDDAVTTTDNFLLTNERGGTAGHELLSVFNDARFGPNLPDGEQSVFLPFQNSIADAVPVENFFPVFSRRPDGDIGTQTLNTSTIIPHISILGTTIPEAGTSEIVDVYSFTVPVNGDEPTSTVILDIDDGDLPFDSILNLGGPDALGDPLTAQLPDSVDLSLFLFDDAGQQIATSDFDFLDPGSEPQFISFFGTPSFFTEDPFIELELAPGTYTVAVAPETSTVDANGVFANAAEPPTVTGTYELHISIDNKPTNLDNTGNLSYRFDRTSESDGVLRSESFDLSGYTAADLPTFYFDYFYDPAPGDSVEVVAVVTDDNGDEQDFVLPTAFLPTDVADAFFQQRVDLGSVAGNEDVRLEIRYTVGGLTDGSEGLFVDNFLVGFAERGELISGSFEGQTGIVGTSTTSLGEYQLEVRAAAPYTFDPFAPDLTIDTNDRLHVAANIVAPLPSQLVDGDRFTLSDGVRQLTFEFDFDGISIPGNITVDVQSATSSAEVADAIREAINQPLVQSNLSVVAADAGGSSQGLARGSEVALNNLVDGEFIDLLRDDQLGTDRSDVLVGGEFRLPVRYFDSFGDQNVIRSQSLVLVDSNQISDVRAIGVYTENGERLADPQDARPDDPTVFLFNDDNDVIGEGFAFGTFEYDTDDEQDFLELPPMGNNTPGAVRNLPTLNNSEIGGLIPGPVIVNNTIDQAGYAGIKVQGATRPFVIDSSIAGGDTILIGDEPFNFGDFITDGLLMVVDAAGTRVIFEFEEIGGDPRNAGGSAKIGGDGYADGHVPIYFRHSAPPDYNPEEDFSNTDWRDIGHTRHETMMSIYQSILGSPLVTNGLVQLADVKVGPSPFFADPIEEQLYLSEIAFPTPSVFLEGVTNVYFDNTYQTVVPGNPFFVDLAPVHDAPQPLARIVNNTIYGDDGTASAAAVDASEPNDTLATATPTGLSLQHDGRIIIAGNIGDETTRLAPGTDVDLYRVELNVGDRLVIDLDSDPAFELDSSLRLFDESGIEVAQNNNLTLGDGLDITRLAFPSANDPPVQGVDFDLDVQGIDANNNDVIDANEIVDVDPAIDFTATETGTYYIGVNTAGNDLYDPTTVNGRVVGVGGTGDYTLNLELFAPRSFVLSLDNDSTASRDTGTQTGDALIGATFTITQIPDRDETLDTPGQTNVATFEFVDGNAPARLPSGNVPIPLADGNDYYVPDIIRAIADAIDGGNNPALANHEFGNGPQDFSGPIQRVKAAALGGQDGILDFPGDDAGLRVYDGPPVVFTPTDIPYDDPREVLHYLVVAVVTGDFQHGFGHDRLNGIDSGPAAPTTGGDGTTEQYVFVERAARIDLSPEAIAAGLALDPRPGENTDQLIPETGLLLTGGSSATVANNVFSNLHQSLVVEQTDFDGFGGLGVGRFYKEPDVVVTANVFNADAPTNPIFRERINIAGQTFGITTDAATGPSNVNGGNDDFNVTVSVGDPLFVNAEGNNFLPDEMSVLIDASVNALTERQAITTLRNSIGLGVSNVLAPTRDVNGVLRADNPDIAPPPGLGSNIFKDRGSNELADEVGPIATLFDPLDNDPENIDIDPATGFLELTDGVYEEFRIQLRDTGDSSDPFRGLGVDDDTVVVPPIGNLRMPGANFTLFENENLLVEGIDYTFEYDETQNVVTLRPLAGVFRNDRAYRISLNNSDSNIVVAPAGNQVIDGSQLSITTPDGARLVFEIETGIGIDLPNPLTLIVPEVPLGVGGINDGDVFTISDGRELRTFEFDANTGTLGTSIVIQLPTDPPPTDPDELLTYRQGIATSIADAIAAEVADTDSEFDVSVRAIGDRVIVGTDLGGFANTESSGLRQSVNTLALQVPPTGIANRDGDTFEINDGIISVTFELDTDGQLNDPSNQLIFVGGQAATQSAVAIADAIDNSDLAVEPLLIGDPANPVTIYLNLPEDGFINVPGGILEVRGVTRLPEDGDQIQVTAVGATEPIIFELNRTDLVDENGDPIDDGVVEGNVPINFTRGSTAEEIGESLINAIVNVGPIAGINNSALAFFGDSLLSIGGEVGLNVEVVSDSIRVLGEPGVTDPSTLAIAGPVQLTIPFLGGDEIEDGDVIIIDDEDGNEIVFEFVENNRPTSVPNARPVVYTNLSQSVDIANALVTAINAVNLGIVATLDSDRIVSLGRIDIDRVNLSGQNDSGTLPPPPASNIDGDRFSQSFGVERGLVEDGEVLTIRQGDIEVNFEFDLAQGGGGVAVGNVPIIFSRDSTVENVNAQIASTISQNLRGLALNPVVGADQSFVVLNDQPGTIIDLSAAPSLQVEGVPGGANAVRISPASSSIQIKEALIAAINSVDPTLTDVRATDRGGNTFFVTGGELFDGPLTTFALPAIADVAGNPLEANREDGTTQFTLLLPGIGLDYGDAPDPRLNIPGRYPTLLANNGPRHIVDPADFEAPLRLGTAIDIDANGQPSAAANGDDLSIVATSTTGLFDIQVVDGVVRIDIRPTAVDPLTADGQTITITSGLQTATLEFDIDGRFDEDNFAIAPLNPGAVTSIRDAVSDAIDASGLGVASVGVDPDDISVLLVSADDEDGVIFQSDPNPGGFLNAGVALPIDVTVSGAGILQAWIDFNADGDFDEANELVIPQPEGPNFQTVRDDLCPVSEQTTTSNIFDGETNTTRTFCIVVPPTASLPETLTETFARFRVSREGDLTPSGLALSGEVEDYRLLIQPGGPPTLGDAEANRTYTASEDVDLQVLDRDGSLTPGNGNDNGLLAGVIDPDGQAVEIFADDVGIRSLSTISGTFAGTVQIFSDGTFVFDPAADFFGTTSFTVRVTDVDPLQPDNFLVAPSPITVTINVDPVNDRPVAAVAGAITTTVNVNEDVVTNLSASTLIDPFYRPGPANENDQTLIFQSVEGDGLNRTDQGGFLSISSDGRTVTYIPPADLNGVTDSFEYVVGDVPGGALTPQLATRRGTVFLNLIAQNDPPRTGTDFYTTEEGSSVAIPIRADDDTGILDNDTAGPPDELVPQPNGNRQGVRLVRDSFPITTFRGGTVSLSGDNLVYVPPAFFDGRDNFDYQVIDVLEDADGNIVPGATDVGLVNTGTVIIDVGSVNDGPEFIRVDNDGNVLPIRSPETQIDGIARSFNLDEFFRDRENDPVSYALVDGPDTNLVSAELSGTILTLRYNAFRPGTTSVTIAATDAPSTGAGITTTVTIPIIIDNQPDAPELIGTLDPLVANEDTIATADLATVFRDRDNEPLTYTVTRFGNVTGTAAQIANAINDSPLVDSIALVGNELRIAPELNASGSVVIEITASDGSSSVSDQFTLQINAVQDPPNAIDDAYSLSIGSERRVIDPADGLLRNDFDPDGDAVTISDASVGEFDTPLGTITIQRDGTFTYLNRRGGLGDRDEFTYTVTAGGQTATANVSFLLTESSYQNPVPNFAQDVNADGVITPIDALRIINLLRREQAIAIPISELDTPPPDFYDVNGDGRVDPTDALQVINRIRSDRNGAEGEQIVSASPESIARFASTSLVVGSDAVAAPIANVAPVYESAAPSQEIDSRGSAAVAAAPPKPVSDSLFAAGLSVELAVDPADLLTDTTGPNQAADAVVPSLVDEALATDWGEITLDPDD